MKKRKTLAMGLAVAMAVSCLAGCGGDDKKASSDGKTEQVLNISNNSVVVGLNPLINTTGPDNSAFNMVLDPLVKRVTQEGNTYKIVPAAAESWDISEDGLTYTFHMNKDAKWSDGTKVTANDFEFTFQKMATPSVAATNGCLMELSRTSQKLFTIRERNRKKSVYMPLMKIHWKSKLSTRHLTSWNWFPHQLIR